jgi:hypothetical protein
MEADAFAPTPTFPDADPVIVIGPSVIVSVWLAERT